MLALSAAAIVLYFTIYSVPAALGSPKGYVVVLVAVLLTYFLSRPFMERHVRPSVSIRFRPNGLWVRNTFVPANEAWSPRVVPHWNEDLRRKRGTSAYDIPAVFVILDAGPGLVHRVPVAQICAPDAAEVGERFVAAIAQVADLMRQPRRMAQTGSAATVSGQPQGMHDDW